MTTERQRRLESLPYDALVKQACDAIDDGLLWYETATREQARNEELLAELAALRADAARWQHVSRRGPMAMQVFDRRVGEDADRAVDAAIEADEAERFAREYPQGVTA